MKAESLWRNLGSILSFRLMQFWGTYRGYAQHGAVSKALRQKFYYPNDSSVVAEATANISTHQKRIDYTGHEAANERE
jgi:hypothetical protein